MKNKFCIVICFFLFISTYAQVNKLLSYEEYIGYVKQFHPLSKIADLQLTQAQSNLLLARGAFDPKLVSDFSEKNYKDKEYYQYFEGGLKIPTWFGLEFKANYETTSGQFLNEENVLPTDGLTSLGVSIPLLQGFLINQRMADLKNAKIGVKLSQSERQLMATQIIYDASVAYINWIRAYKESQLYEKYLTIAEIRLNAIKRLIEAGDKPSIDETEATIAYNNRKISFEEAKFKLIKASLEVSNFLWTSSEEPLEIDGLKPQENLNDLNTILQVEELQMENFDWNSHPKINAFQQKLSMLEVERKLKANLLLPKVDLGYSYLSEPNTFNNFNLNNYKLGINFYFPIFLRKERGSLQLTKQKIEAQNYLLNLERKQLNNKLKAQNQEVNTLIIQQPIVEKLVKDNERLLQAEESLFNAGESTLFFINSRESSLISAQINLLNFENRKFITQIERFKTIAPTN